MLADPQFGKFVLEMIPLGRMACAEDAAAAVLYLCSPAVAMVTGTSLLVDGFTLMAPSALSSWARRGFSIKRGVSPRRFVAPI